MQCKVCYDYDLCIKCFESERTSKDHKTSHSVTIIQGTRIRDPENLTLTEDVNPQADPSNPKRLQWTNCECTKDSKGEVRRIRILRLFAKNSHARFLTDVKPGRYEVSLFLNFQFSQHISKPTLTLIEEQGMGVMRASIGMVRSQREFRRAKYPEDAVDVGPLSGDCLPCQLLRNYSSKAFNTPLGDIFYHVSFDSLVHITGAPDDCVDVGLVLQWSGAKQFPGDDLDAVLRVGVESVRFVPCLPFQLLAYVA